MSQSPRFPSTRRLFWDCVLVTVMTAVSTLLLGAGLAVVLRSELHPAWQVAAVLGWGWWLRDAIEDTHGMWEMYRFIRAAERDLAGKGR